MKGAIIFGVVLVVALLLGWGLATFDLTDRVSRVAKAAQGLCKTPRGRAESTDAMLAERFAAMAEEARLEASEVRIDMHQIKPGDSGAVGQAAGQLAALTKGKLKMEATEVTISARLQGSKWLWSEDRTIESTCVVKGKVSRVGR